MTRPMLRIPALLAFAALAFAPVVASAQRTTMRLDDSELSRIDTTFAFAANGVVDLSQVSGNITVTAWTRQQVKISAYVESGSIRADLSSKSVSLEVRSRRGRIGDSEFRLQVPVGTRIIAHNTSGDITVTGVKAQAELKSVSGDVHVSDATDRITLESVSGSVHGSQLIGMIRATTVSGDVDLDQVKGDLEVETTSGEIKLRGVASSNVRTETVSGDVEFRGALDKSGRYEFKSHSGTIHVGIPEGTGASFSVTTFSGSVDSDLPMTLQPSSDPPQGSNRGRRGTGRRNMEFTIGGGGARVTATSFSGDITIERAKAGSGKEEQ